MLAFHTGSSVSDSTGESDQQESGSAAHLIVCYNLALHKPLTLLPTICVISKRTPDIGVKNVLMKHSI